MKEPFEPQEMRRIVGIASVQPSWSSTLEKVAEMAGVPIGEIMGRGRRRKPTRARQMAMLALRMKGLSQPQVAYRMRRDHTTVLHAERTIRRIAEIDQ